MMYKCIAESIIFGFLYGVYFTKEKSNQMRYYFGQWTYKDRISAIFHCISMLLAAAILPGMVFAITTTF